MAGGKGSRGVLKGCERPELDASANYMGYVGISGV